MDAQWKRAKKAPRPRAAAPRGFRDYFGAEVVARQRMLDAICGVYRAYGFDPLESPAVETVEALGKYLPDVDRPNEGVFAWQDDDETWLALRYDLTAPLARVFAQHRRELPSPYRRYQVGPVWRNEKPGPGRFRQFYQCDADTVGTPTVAADAEICMMLADALEAVGIARGDYLVRINNRKVLNGVMEEIGLWSPDDPEAKAPDRGIVLRAIDKLDRLGEEGVRALLGAGRKDESGDFTQGARLSALQIDVVMAFVQAHSKLQQRLSQAAGDAGAINPANMRTLDRARYSASPEFRSEQSEFDSERPLWNQSMVSYLRDVVGRSVTGWEGVKELETIAELIETQGYGGRMLVDPSVVRGLGYYTGPVYEAELTFEITDEQGQRRQFGSVAGGGRYDDLVKRFTGETVPATGVSIGVDRLLAALSAIGRAGTEDAAGPVVILAMDRDRMAGYQTMCAELRRAGVRAEVFLGGGNMSRQLKYADRRGAPVAVIEGGDERAAGQVTLKDLALGARLAAEIETHDEWKAQPAQITVPRGELVEQVRRMLARAAG
jgi:histidyl-tRNA synthetase